jgi:hypothetical protein
MKRVLVKGEKKISAGGLSGLPYRGVSGKHHSLVHVMVCPTTTVCINIYLYPVDAD